MVHADVLDLINRTYSVDSIGQKVPIETVTTIYVDIRSISRTEWFNAGQIGLQPAFVAITPYSNYGGQTECVFHNKRYSIYRTYQSDDNIELYLEEKVGS